MPNRLSTLLRCTALSTALALAACGQGQEANLAGLDNSLVGNDADPALTSALQDQIAIDPNLVNQSNRNAVRPPETPTQAQYPTGQSGAQASAAAGSDCQAPDQFNYNRAWANRLPAALPVYPGGRIAEAAGNNHGNCRSRVVTFTTADAPQRVLAFYQDRATKGGYSADRQVRGGDQVLGGANGRDGSAFYLIVTPLPSGGSDVALIADNGR